MNNIFLKKEVKDLEIDLETVKRLNENNIYTINDLWNLSQKELKKLKLTTTQINNIIIKMQLQGIDLKKRNYNNK